MPSFTTFFCTVHLCFEEGQNGKYSLQTLLQTFLGCFRISLCKTTVPHSSLGCPKLSPCSYLAALFVTFVVCFSRGQEKQSHISVPTKMSEINDNSAAPCASPVQEELKSSGDLSLTV